MLVKDLMAELQKFQPNQEVMVMPSPEKGDMEFKIIGVDNWDVGPAPGTCVITIETPEEEAPESPEVVPPTPKSAPTSPESIAQQIPEEM